MPRFMSQFPKAFLGVAFVLFMLVFGGVADLLGYTLLGYKWPASQVLYYVNPQNIYMSNAVALTAIQNAASGWTAQSGANIQLVYAGTTSASAFSLNSRNEVFFRNNSTSSFGESYWYSDAAGNLVDADIAFNQGTAQFTADGLPCNNAINIQDLAMHEFGHSLGLRHSALPDATMYANITAWCDTSWRSLSTDDILGVTTLYPAVSVVAPAAPSGLSVSRNPSSATSSLVVAWTDNASNENGFRVQRGPDGVSFTQIAELGPGVTGYTDQGLAAGTRYYYRVQSFNAAGASSYSNTASAVTDAAVAPPATPTLSVRIARARKQGKAELAWSGFTGASVDVYRNGGLLVVTPNDGVHSDPLTAKGSYTYRVCASGGTATCSANVTVTY